MSKNLIVVFTRMYAQRGSDEDEFFRNWDIEQDKEKKYIPYYSGDSGEHCYALIVHGYCREEEAPDGFSADGCDEQCVVSARESIREGISLLSPPVSLAELVVGVAFHVEWESDSLKLFRNSMRDFLQEEKAQVGFIKRYSMSTSRFPPLIAKLRRAQDITQEYRRVWTYFVEDVAAYVSYLAELINQLHTLLEPLSLDIEGWRKSDFNAGYWQDIAARWGEGLPQERLDATKALACGSSANTDSVLKLVTELMVNFRKNKPQLAEEVEGSLKNVADAFNNANLSPVSDLLEVFANACQHSKQAPHHEEDQAASADPTTAMGMLRVLLSNGNALEEWYGGLKESLDALLRFIVEGYRKAESSKQ